MRRDKRIPRTLQIAAAFEGEKIGHIAGDIVRFRGDGSPLRSLRVGIDPIQDLHGYDSPWPAGGGVNLLDISIATALNATHGLTKSIDSAGFVHLDGIVDSTSETLNIAVIRAGESQIDALTGKNYVISMTDVSGGTIRSAWGLRDIDNGSIACGVINPGNGTELHMKFRVVVATAKQTTFSPYSNLCPISGWTEANVWVKPTYDPTADPTATIQLGQTVYGGYIQVGADGSAELVVDKAEVDLGTLDWSAWGTVEGLYGANISDMKAPTTADERKTEIICSMYPVASTATMNNNFTDKSCARYQQNVFIRDTGYATADALAAALDGVQFVYPLATPLHYPLSDITISTLAGQNVLWADAGPVDVEYVADNGVEGGKLALLLRNRPELLIAMRKGAPTQELLLAMGGRGDAKPGITPLKPVEEKKDEDEEAMRK